MQQSFNSRIFGWQYVWEREVEMWGERLSRYLLFGGRSSHQHLWWKILHFPWRLLVHPGWGNTDSSHQCYILQRDWGGARIWGLITWILFCSHELYHYLSAVLMLLRPITTSYVYFVLMCSCQDNYKKYTVLVDLSQCGWGRQKTCLKSVSFVMDKISQVRHTHIL